VPTFEQSNKPVRLGSEVLLVYPAGDCDVAMVTGISRSGSTVWVQVPGQVAQLVGSESLAPFEAEDMDPIWTDDEVETSGQGMQWQDRS
jgi:hypothetical protein